MTQFRTDDVVSLVGRTFIAGIFLAAGFGKFKDRAGTIGYMKSKNLPLAPALAPLAGSLEMASGLSLLSGYRPRLGAAAAMVFLIPTTLIFHDFWRVRAEEKQMQQVNFLKNLAIMGGLLNIVIRGAGALSLRSRSGGTGFIRDLREELPKFRTAA